MKANGYTFCDAACEKDVLRYGEYVVDEMYDTWDGHTYRLRASDMMVSCTGIKWQTANWQSLGVCDKLRVEKFTLNFCVYCLLTNIMTCGIMGGPLSTARAEFVK